MLCSASLHGLTNDLQFFRLPFNFLPVWVLPTCTTFSLPTLHEPALQPDWRHPLLYLFCSSWCVSSFEMLSCFDLSRIPFIYQSATLMPYPYLYGLASSSYGYIPITLFHLLTYLSILHCIIDTCVPVSPIRSYEINA